MERTAHNGNGPAARFEQGEFVDKGVVGANAGGIFHPKVFIEEIFVATSFATNAFPINGFGGQIHQTPQMTGLNRAPSRRTDQFGV